MKFCSGDAFTRLRLGSESLSVCKVYEMVMRLTVSRIMLAKAMMIVIMMRMETMPPVKVLY